MNKLLKIIISFLIFIQGSLYDIPAQSSYGCKKIWESDFKQYKSEYTSKFKAYRDSINSEFAEYMRHAWPEFELKPAKPVPSSPEPPAPIVKDPDKEPSKDPIPFDDIKPVPAPVEPPQPIVPLPEPQPKDPDKQMFSFTFYGKECKVSLGNRHRFTLSETTENGCADCWTILSSDEYLPVISNCLDYREKLRLNDWGYARFIEKMTNDFFSYGHQNEARMMHMYILSQSGYNVRLARVGKKLVLLLPSKDTIYEYPYIKLEGYNYYLFDSSIGNTSINVFNRKFAKEQCFSLQIREQPELPVNKTTTRNLKSKHNPELTADIYVNKNLIEFYNDYPQSFHWDIYSNASLSKTTKEQLYPVLLRSIYGKNKQTAANILLHFVQTAFPYKTDNEQFGRERALFADETLFYPYSDCEDRAILYSILVRELLGLDVILIHYPGHLATAVCFKTEIAGDYLQIEGKRYIVCDPTYINADIGQSMPQFKHQSANIIKLQ